MKAKYVILTLAIIFLGLSSCREITVKTSLNTDGSFTRTIIIKGDSADVIKSDLPYPVDASWERNIIRDTVDSTKFICTYTKEFRDDGSLNASIRKDSGWRKQINREIMISKRFMFFYSFLTYREVYEAADPSKLLDYKDYLSAADMEWLRDQKVPLNTQDSMLLDTAEARAGHYLHDALTEEIRLTLQNGLERSGDPELKTIDVSLYKDSIAKYDTIWYDNNFHESIDALAAWTGNEKINELHNLSPPVFEELHKKIQFFDKIMMMAEYNVEVEMPGLITATNSTQLIGNTVSWHIHSLSFYFDDYEMYVESRVINYWAFIVAGVVLFALIILMIRKLFL
jgi:hypothetical protein